MMSELDYFIYKVRPNDSLEKIAKLVGMSAKDLCDFHKKKNHKITQICHEDSFYLINELLIPIHPKTKAT